MGLATIPNLAEFLEEHGRSDRRHQKRVEFVAVLHQTYVLPGFRRVVRHVEHSERLKHQAGAGGIALRAKTPDGRSCRLVDIQRAVQPDFFRHAKPLVAHYYYGIKTALWRFVKPSRFPLDTGNPFATKERQPANRLASSFGVWCRCKTAPYYVRFQT